MEHSEDKLLYKFIPQCTEKIVKENFSVFTQGALHHFFCPHKRNDGWGLRGRHRPFPPQIET